MKALSVVSPNGSRIAKGFKTIEVRSWTPDLDCHEEFLIVENDRYLVDDGDLDPNGRVVAIASVKSVREYTVEDIPSACATIWEKGYHSWELDNVRPVECSARVEARKGIYVLDIQKEDLRVLPPPTPVFDEGFYRERFRELLRRNELVSEILKRSEALNVQNWAVGAGFIQQTIFNLYHGYPVLEGVKDIDWVYYDSSDLSEEAEAQVVSRVQSLMKDISLPFDVKNQARVHLWYKRKFGYDIQPYRSLEDAIATWPTTSTAVALTQNAAGMRIIATFGLSDLMNGIVRPNNRQITEEIYLQKVERWKKHWARLQFVPWDFTSSL